jgi:secreted PhoX family phosphatase
MPEFRFDASNSADEQALQAGMHHDGMHFFALPSGAGGAPRGLLAMNHEYLDEGLLFTDGQKTWSADKVLKAQHAVGVSVVEVEERDGAWQLVRPSRYARRITARTPCDVSGPAAGHALLRTAADPAGRRVLGTYSGCAHGWTPWGTYLTCEENWHFQFVNRGTIPGEQRRYRITATGRRYRWEEFDARFDAAAHPNEPNRFGWVVEIDPTDPAAPPVKRTALGRMAHEGAACSVGPDRRLAFYMADDWEFEYVYKFVTARPWNPTDRGANRDLLDAGVLYVARFDAGGTGEWLPLVHGQGPLTAAGGFPDQATVLIRARQAADALGATKMDRPEWIVPHPVTREVYAACSSNSARGRDGNEGSNPANRRAPNAFGHIVRWREDGSDPAATRFRWDVFVAAGPAGRGGTIAGDVFACPDGLWFDARGALWVQTDISPTALGTGDFAPLGNNQIVAVDPATGVFKRFLTGPRGCEVTAFHTTPDNRTAFVNIQHPGEAPGDRSNPENPRAHSNWPDHRPDGRPRSATIAIRRRDGGPIGT